MSQEAMPGGNYSMRIVQDLWQGRSLGGAGYNNIIVSSTVPGIIDTYDRGITTEARLATLYWPGADPETGASLETIAIKTAEAPIDMGDAGRVRQAILKARIGNAALRRVPLEVRRAWADLEQEAPVPPIDLLEAGCREASVPLVVCATSEVTNRKPGQRMMHMWYPGLVNPRPALKKLQEAVQRAIAQETL